MNIYETNTVYKITSYPKKKKNQIIQNISNNTRNVAKIFYNYCETIAFVVD